MTANREPKGQPNGGEFAASKNPESNVDLNELEYFAPWAITRQNVSEALRNAASIIEHHDVSGGESDFRQVGEIIRYSQEVVEPDASTSDLREWLDTLSTQADWLSDFDTETPEWVRAAETPEWLRRALGANIATILGFIADQLSVARKEDGSA